MNQSRILSFIWFPLIMLALYMAAVWFRPLLPIDETRYMSVAWEMFLRKNWFAPLTANFEPYHHKPPLLFWLINSSWSVFGISRWAGLIPIVISASLCVYLTNALARLFLLETSSNQRVMMIMAGSLPFLIYSTIVLFDLTLTVFVLLSLIMIVLYSRDRRLRYILLLGIFMGCGVLTKGPVAYLYILPPLLLAPLWITDFKKPLAWYGYSILALEISILIILIWLVPILKQSDDNFAFWLVWNQTAGRISGNFNSAHVRPFYFYLPLIPVMLMPWIFFPSFWRGFKSIKNKIWESELTRFLTCFTLPAFAAFCLISGKQPHYLVPLLPGIIIFIYLCLQGMKNKHMEAVLTGMVCALLVGQAVASPLFSKYYDISPVAVYVQEHQDHPWAYVRNYHAELGFEARLTHPVDDVQREDIQKWFGEHPGGFAIIRYKNIEEIKDFHMILDGHYRGKRLGVFSAD